MIEYYTLSGICVCFNVCFNEVTVRYHCTTEQMVNINTPNENPHRDRERERKKKNKFMSYGSITGTNAA